MKFYETRNCFSGIHEKEDQDVIDHSHKIADCDQMDCSITYLTEKKPIHVKKILSK